jgi:hypothetical protein
MTRSNVSQALTEADACQALAVAVIHQALLDATGQAGHPTLRVAADVETARAFLTRNDEWGASREMWCAMAGLDPGYLDRKIAALQAEGKL